MSKLQDLKDKQNRWMRERQAEMDRNDVMTELQPQGYSQQSGQRNLLSAPSSPQLSSHQRESGSNGSSNPRNSSGQNSSSAVSTNSRNPGPRYGTNTNGDSRSSNSSGNSSPIHRPGSGNSGPMGQSSAPSSSQLRGSRFQDPNLQNQNGSSNQAPAHEDQIQSQRQHQNGGGYVGRGESYNDGAHASSQPSYGSSSRAEGSGGTNGSAQFWAQVKPEDVINRLTERITDRLRSELKVELQKESDTWQGEAEAGDRYLAKELESQNTCPICYDLMVPPDHAPVMLFPCGHTFCGGCIRSHMDKHRKLHCPLCRKKIESKAPNFSLQQLILNWVGRQARVKAGGLRESAVYRSSNSSELDAVGSGNGSISHGSGAATVASEEDRLRRQADRMAMRLKVLSNEMLDTLTEESEIEGQRVVATAALSRLQGQEADVLKRMALLQQELEHLHRQMEGSQGTVDNLSNEAEGIRQRRTMLQATIGPLTSEVEKLEILLEGLEEMEAEEFG